MLTMRTLGEILLPSRVVFGAGKYAAVNSASWPKESSAPATHGEGRILTKVRGFSGRRTTGIKDTGEEKRVSEEQQNEAEE